MNVLMLSTLPEGGGAEVSTALLYRELSALGHNVHVRVSAGLQCPEGYSATPFDFRRRRWLHRIRWAPWTFAERLGVEQCVGKESRYVLDDLPFEPDVIHLNNVRRRILRIEDLPRLVKWAPVVWTLRDMWPLTGHCCHAFECERWKKGREGCGKCPHLCDAPMKLRHDFSRLNLRRRRRVYRWISRNARGRFRLVAPSQWMADNVKQSAVAHDLDVSLIRNGIDLNLFRPYTFTQKAQVRLAHGIPEDAYVILYAANGGRENPFRDFSAFERVVEHEQDRVRGAQVIVPLVVGGRLSRPCPGTLLNERAYANVPHDQMPDFYNMADVYVHPAKADTAPLSIMEAMACGVGVIATDVGGIPEMLPELDEDSPLFGFRLREYAFRHFDIRWTAEEYAALYAELV